MAKQQNEPMVTLEVPKKDHDNPAFSTKGYKKAFPLSHAQNILQSKSGWQLSDSKFELKNGEIVRKN